MARVKKECQDQYNTAFAQRLRELLNAPGMSQSQLADYIGVTRQAVSSYSLGTSVPDIQKFEKIADFFQVSTEYLLGRSSIKKADATKQAAAEYLGLSEEAIDAIHRLKLGRFEQSFADGYRMTLKTEPLTEVFSAWLEAADLSAFASDIYRAVQSMELYTVSGKYPEKYTLTEEEKEAVYLLQMRDYTVLPLSQQVDFYTQAAAGEFQQAVSRLLDETMKLVGDETP